MITTETTTETTTKFDLATGDEASTASVTTTTDGEGWTYAKVSLEAFVSSDIEDETVYLDLRQNTFARIGRHDDDRLNSFVGLMTHRFTREQAEALVKVLSHELAKF